MRIFIILFFYLKLFSNTYDFEELLDILKKNNIDILSSKIKTQIATQELNIANSNLYPKLSFNINLNSSQKKRIDFNLKYASQISLRMNYNFYNFNADTFNIKSSKSNLLAKKYLECEAVNEASLNLLGLYHNILDIRNKINLYKKLDKLYVKKYELLNGLYKSNQISETEIINSALKIANNSQNLIQIQKQENNILIKLSNLLNINLNEKDKFEKINFKESDKELEEKLKNLNFEDTSQSKFLLANIEQKFFDFKNKKAKRLPSFSFFTDYVFYKNDSDFRHSFSGLKTNGFKIGISFKYDIFDGFEKKSKIEMANLQLKLANLNYENAKNQYDRNIQELKYSLKNINDIKLNTKKILENSKKLLNIGINSQKDQSPDDLKIIDQQINYYYNFYKFKEVNLRRDMLIFKENLIIQGAENCKVSM